MAYDEAAGENLTDDKLTSYYYHSDYLNDNNWYSNAFMEDLYNPDNGNLRYLVCPQPDEFIFNLPNGISGSFFLNHLGVWQVKSKSTAGLKVSVDVNQQPFVLTNPHNNKSITIKRLIYIIIIKDPQGFTYTFGNDKDAIEFTRSGPGSSYNYNNNVIANTWNLTKIESPLGNTVNFKYVRKENQYQMYGNYPVRFSAYASCGGGSGSSSGSGPCGYSGSIITPCFLTQITASSFTVNFSMSESAELKQDYYKAKYAFEGVGNDDIDIDRPGKPNTPEYITSLVKYYQLDDINITDINGNTKEKYKFKYDNNASDRLFLERFSKIDIFSNAELAPYNFTYNSTALPAYNSFQVDKWGYYNAKQFPITNNPPPPATEQAAMPYFDMVEQYAKAGILIRIKYPTGGYTNFDYEPNSYYAILQKTNNAITLINQNGTGGGLRIKQITNYDNIGNSSWKKYSYSALANPNISSGILAGISRIYTTEQIGSNPVYGVIERFNYTDNRALNYTDGKEVVYNEVKEELQDGSYTIYEYANSNNSVYRDEPPFVTDTWVQEFDGVTSTRHPSSNINPYMSHISRDLERGNLLSQKVYNATGILLNKTEYTYNNDPNRFNQFIRSIVYYSYGVNCGRAGAFPGFAKEFYYQALKTYTYFPYLQQKTDTYYNNDGTQSLKTQTDFIYDPINFQLIKKTVKASNSDLLESIYKYPTDFASISPYNEMINRNILSPIVEKTEKRIIQNLSKEILRSKTNYAYFSNKILPSSSQNSFAGNTLEIEGNYNKYDAKGNILQITGKDGIITSYIWGYNAQYIVAKIINKTYDEAISQSGINLTTVNNPGITDAAMRTELDKLRQLANCYVTIYTYKFLVGVSSETDLNGKSIYYEYDNFNRLILIRDNNKNIVKKICYNYAGQPENCCTSTDPDWQNTPTPPHCRLTTCGYTGYQEQEQKDMNPCSASYNELKWTTTGYSPAVCVPTTTNVEIAYDNSTTVSGFVAVYRNTATGQTFTFNIPTGKGVLGCIQQGQYSISISKPNNTTTYTFDTGCQIIRGISGNFTNTVDMQNCKIIGISSIRLD